MDQGCVHRFTLGLANTPLVNLLNAINYQLEAIQSIADVFDGQPLGQAEFEVSLND